MLALKVNPSIKTLSFLGLLDPFDNEGVFLSLETIEKRNVKTDFIEYASLKKAIFERLNKKNINEIKYVYPVS